MTPEYLTHPNGPVPRDCVRSRFSCGMCLRALKESVIAPCSHIFCRDCLQTWIDMMYPNIHCPTCGSKIRREDERVTKRERVSEADAAAGQKKRRSVFNSQFVEARGALLLFDQDYSETLSLQNVVALTAFFMVLREVILYLRHSSFLRRLIEMCR